MRETYERLLSSVCLPRFFQLDRSAPQPEIADVRESAYQSVKNCPALKKLHPGQTVAVTAGSRDVHGMRLILEGALRALKEANSHPFIVPAMGSHGGATAEGQLRVLAHYGITPETMGVPIHSCMDTVQIGRTESGQAVHVDRIASEADFILPIGRIKAHTDFRGNAESGILKMLVIGLGKQYGASLCHKIGFPRMGESIWSFGKVILENARVLMGLGIIENANHGTALIEAIPAEKILEREPQLLQYSKTLMPKIPFSPLDVLLVSEMGKDISGAGMDPNVTGRSCTTGENWPFAEKIGVFDITDVSDGNAAGIGNADAITRRLYEKLDTAPMYINSITCRDTMGVRIPTIMETEELATKYMLYCCIRRDALPAPRIVWIRNTADMQTIYVSEALLAQAGEISEYRTDARLLNIHADASGRLILEE